MKNRANKLDDGTRERKTMPKYEIVSRQDGLLCQIIKWWHARMDCCAIISNDDTRASTKR